MEVKLTDLQLDTKFLAPFLCIAVMGARFQSSGKDPLLINLLNIIDYGIAIKSLIDLNIWVGQPSGPGDLLL